MNFKVLLIIFNAIVLIVFALDKWLAIKNKWRISEKTLLLLSFCGGSVGGLIAIVLFNHKISKKSFLLKFTAILCVQIIAYFLLKKYS